MTSATELLGPYRLLREIGIGGMGEVHLALDARGRTVAVKILHPAVARDAVSVRRLEREVATMRRIKSPHVVQVIDADFTGPRPYIVTSYVQGRPLNTIVRTEGVIRGDALTRLALGLAKAVKEIHAAGIVHRDVKPGNVMLVEGEPVVIDFGLAHLLDATRLTRTGTAIGTPGYLAPEVLDGLRAGPEADMFSWAATVAYAATGTSPFGTGPAQAVFSRVLRGKFDVSELHDPVRSPVAKALARKPGKRPTAIDVITSLEPPKKRAPKPPRRPWAVLLAAPALCYIAPVVAALVILLASCVIYARDATAWARRHRRFLALAALPFRILVRVSALVAVLAVGYGFLLTFAMLVTDGLSARAFPAGLLAVLAGTAHAWFDRRSSATRRFLAPVLMCVLLAATVVAVPSPIWWPLPVG